MCYCLSGYVIPKIDEPRGEKEIFDGQAGRKQRAKCGSI
jgi:hypothetical protein